MRSRAASAQKSFTRSAADWEHIAQRAEYPQNVRRHVHIRGLWPYMDGCELARLGELRSDEIQLARAIASGDAEPVPGIDRRLAAAIVAQITD